MDSESSSSCGSLRDLPLAPRVVIAVFLISVGVGYFSALVQLHFQHAPPGELLPRPEDAFHAYGGQPGVSLLEKLMLAEETLPFNASGSMRAAFTFRSANWKGRIRDAAVRIQERELKKDEPKEGDKADEKDAKKPPLDLERGEKELRAERYLEADVIVAWLRAGAKEADYNKFTLSDELAKKLPQDLGHVAGLFQRDEKHKARIEANIGAIIESRCIRCHGEGKGGSAGEVHLDKFEVVQDYIKSEHGGMSLRKLAQSTHVHLLGFCMLYGLTGFLFACTPYPVMFRLLLGPFVLIMQLIDISFWWLARLDPPYGQLFGNGIAVTGGLVGAGVGAQILLTVISLFGKKGRMVLALLMLLGLAGFAVLFFTVINPYLGREATGGVIP